MAVPILVRIVYTLLVSPTQIYSHWGGTSQSPVHRLSEKKKSTLCLAPQHLSPLFIREIPHCILQSQLLLFDMRLPVAHFAVLIATRALVWGLGQTDLDFRVSDMFGTYPDEGAKVKAADGQIPLRRGAQFSSLPIQCLCLGKFGGVTMDFMVMVLGLLLVYTGSTSMLSKSSPFCS